MTRIGIPVIAAFAATLTCSTLVAQDAPAQSDLKILFVGHDPEAPQRPFSGAFDENRRMKQLYAERTPAFEKFLRGRFKRVRVVLSADYAVAMSNDADVTIFDARPKVLTPGVNEVDPATGQRVYKPASYLPMDFDRPALTIAENSPRIGEPLGLKLDWL